MVAKRLIEYWDQISNSGLHVVNIHIPANTESFEPSTIIVFKGNYGDVLLTHFSQDRMSVEAFPDDGSEMFAQVINMNSDDKWQKELLVICAGVAGKIDVIDSLKRYLSE